MFRKITNVIGIILLVSLVFIYVMGKFKNREVDSEIYALDMLYLSEYSQTKEYNLNYYLYDEIDANDLSFSLLDENAEVPIIISSNEVVGKSKYKGNKYNIMNLSYYLAKPIKSDTLVIRADNFKYYLNIGDIIVTKTNKKPLYYNSLQGHYGYINDTLLLVGISLSLNCDLFVSKIAIGSTIYAQLQNIKIITELPSILDDLEEYDYQEKTAGTFTLKKDIDYFIPLGYEKLQVVDTADIYLNDNYYIEGIPFQITPRDLNDYHKYLTRGKLDANK